MNAPLDLEARLAQLREEVGPSPDLARRVLAQAGAAPLPVSSMISHILRAPWRWAGALAAAALVVLAIWLAAPASTAAQILRALERVDSVHVTGTIPRVTRKWAVEQLPAAPAEAQRPVAFEAWYWTDSAGAPQSYEVQGPVTLVRRGTTLSEYQRDVDLLYVFENAYAKDRVRRFSELADHLRALARPGLAKRDLGTKTAGGRILAGLELSAGGLVRTLWWDAETFLPQHMAIRETLPDGRLLASQFAFTYNEPVPADVAHWKTPTTKNIRYAGSEKAALAWQEHVATLGRQLQDKPVRGRAALLPRQNGRVFSVSWTLPTPDGRYVVTPLGGFPRQSTVTLFDALRLYIGPLDPACRLENWHVPPEFRHAPYCHDVVYEAGVAWPEWMQVVLAHHGLEFVDVVERRTVWVARYDGHTNQPPRPVDPPVPYIVQNGVEKRGLVKCGVGFRLTPVTLKTLFEDFNTLQAHDATGKSIIIDDQTGLPRPPEFDAAVHGTSKNYWHSVIEPKYLVATDSPHFRGPDSLDMARTWYRDRLGITFTEETRPMTVHVVRRKANP